MYKRQEHYEALCRALEREDLIDDPRFPTNAERVARNDEILAIVHAEFRKKTTAEWVEILTREGVMHAPVADYGDYLADPHVRSVESIVMAEHPGVGAVPQVNIPGVAPIVPGTFLAESPRLGQHGHEILAEAGYGEDAIAELIESGAVGVPR